MSESLQKEELRGKKKESIRKKEGKWGRKR